MMYGIIDCNFRVLKIYPELSLEEVRQKTANLNQGMQTKPTYADKLPYSTIKIEYAGED